MRIRGLEISMLAAMMEADWDPLQNVEGPGIGRRQ